MLPDSVPPHRKQLRRREIHMGPRYLTCSCNHRLPLFDNDCTKSEFVEVLALARDRHGFRLFAWVLMPEHVHLLLIPAGSDVPALLIGIKKTLSERVIRHWRIEGSPLLASITAPDGRPHFWLPGGGFDRNPRDGDEFAKTIRYIHANPVRRGLVTEPADWPWSSARWYAGEREGQLRIDPIDHRAMGF